MVKQKVEKDNIIHFNSINEVVKYNREHEHTKEFMHRHGSTNASDFYCKFTRTNSYEEAEDLLLHGWDEMAKELNNELNKIKINSLGNKNRTVYSVAGFQCSVPRYLQGIPTNMISTKQIKTKQKVINITKDFGYASVVKAETIKKESIKVLKLIRDLESNGYRVNLNIAFVSQVYEINKPPYKVCISIRIKNATQKLNIKQLAFPLVHPSMFRRICFALIERLPECEWFGSGYGLCTNYEDEKHLFKGDYLIPTILKEKEITDIEKYKC